MNDLKIANPLMGRYFKMPSCGDFCENSFLGYYKDLFGCYFYVPDLKDYEKVCDALFKYDIKDGFLNFECYVLKFSQDFPTDHPAGNFNKGVNITYVKKEFRVPYADEVQRRFFRLIPVEYTKEEFFDDIKTMVSWVFDINNNILECIAYDLKSEYDIKDVLKMLTTVNNKENESK